MRIVVNIVVGQIEIRNTQAKLHVVAEVLNLGIKKKVQIKL